MKVDKDLVKKVAELSKIILGDDEAAHFTKEMTEILRYVDQLNEVNVDGVAPTDQVTGLRNVFREDVVIDYPTDKREKLLRSVPRFENGYVVVPKII